MRSGDRMAEYTPDRVKTLLRRYLNMDAAERIVDMQLGREISSVSAKPSRTCPDWPAWYYECLTLLTLARQPHVTERQEKALDWNLRRRTPAQMQRDIGYVAASGRDTLTQAEIAEVLCVHVDTINMDIRNALQQIADRMNAGEFIPEIP